MVKCDAKELSDHMVDSELEISLKVHFSSLELHCLDLNWSWSCGQAYCPRASHASWRLPSPAAPQQCPALLQITFTVDIRCLHLQWISVPSSSVSQQE